MRVGFVVIPLMWGLRLSSRRLARSAASAPGSRRRLLSQDCFRFDASLVAAASGYSAPSLRRSSLAPVGRAGALLLDVAGTEHGAIAPLGRVSGLARGANRAAGHAARV